MDASFVIKTVQEAGVQLHLDNGQLAFKAKQGQFSADLRSMVREHRDLIIAHLAQQDRRGRLTIAPLGQRCYPLSHSQRRLHFLTQLQDGAANYNLRVALQLRGELDRPALNAALNMLVERHQVLRTTYEVTDAQVQQRVNDARPLAFEEIELTHLGGAAQEAALQELMAQEARRRFDLASDSVLAVRLVALAEDCHAILLTIHHIATDGTSMTILTREFMQLYEALRHGRPGPLSPLPFQFGDFAAWQQGVLGKAVLHEQLGFWQEALAGVPTVHQLPLDKPRPAQPDYVGQVHRSLLDAQLLQGLEALAQRHQCTLFIVVKALFAVLLAKYSNSRDIVIGTPAAGREQQGTQSLVGFFANTLVFRHQLTAFDISFGELLQQHRAHALAVFNHQDVPFELLVEELQVERSLSHSPLIQIFLAFQNYEQESLVLDGLRVEPIVPRTHNIRFDLELTVHAAAEGLHLLWGYASSLLESATVERLAASFEAMARQVVADAGKSLRELSALSSLDTQCFLQWNRTQRNYSEPLPLPARIATQAQRTPDATAVDDGERRLTYRQLLRRADGLALALREKGVGPGSLVGVYLPRTVDMVVGLLGIMRAGAAYVPLDPGYPAARLAYIVEDSGLQWVVTDSELQAGIADTVKVLLLDEVADATDSPVATQVVPEQLAYVIYTSGSTGRPKGVMVEHRQLSNFQCAMQEILRMERATWLAVTAYSFDISILELLCPLALGCTVVIADPRRYADTRRSFAHLMTAHAVTHLQCTPSLLRMYMELPEFCRALSQLEMILVGGEACPAPLIERLAQHTRARVLNMYGPTETTIWSSCTELRSGSVVSIGRPIANTHFYVVDEALQAVPVGVQGELLIGGEGVSRGYLGRPELTAERFIELQTAPGQTSRVYRSGDLVRWLANGDLAYVGRCDAQVKIRGHRVELGEIEAQLRALSDVRDAAVMLHETGSGEPVLAAYLVASGVEDASAWVQSCKTRLARELTSYMMPAAFVVLDRLPMTANGKIDRLALPRPQAEHFHQQQFIAAQSPHEIRLEALWRDLLGLERISVAVSFFEVGGHSLLATRLVSRIRKELGAEISLREIFDRQSIREQAELIARQPAGCSGAAAAAEEIEW